MGSKIKEIAGQVSDIHLEAEIAAAALVLDELNTADNDEYRDWGDVQTFTHNAAISILRSCGGIALAGKHDLAALRDLAVVWNAALSKETCA